MIGAKSWRGACIGRDAALQQSSLCAERKPLSSAPRPDRDAKASSRINTMSRSYTERAILTPGSFGLGGFFEAIEQHVVRPVLTWHHHRVTQRELMTLDDRQLADIGLSRGEIEGAAFDPRRTASNRA